MKSSKYVVIDPKKRNRYETYKRFNTFASSTYGIDCEVDIDEVVKFSKETKTSFFINFLYIVMISLTSIDELRMRIEENEIRLYETIDPNFTVMSEAGTFDNCEFEMKDNYKDFYKEAHRVIEETKKEKTIKEGYNTSINHNQYYITCIPWCEFLSMSHPVPANDKISSSVPRICWCKYYLKNNRYNVVINVTVDHTLVDGYPLSNAINALKKNSTNCRDFFKN